MHGIRRILIRNIVEEQRSMERFVQLRLRRRRRRRRRRNTAGESVARPG